MRTYNTSGGFLHTPIEQVMENADRVAGRGIGGIKLKVGQPDWQTDIARVTAVREHLGDDVPLMVDANQQWDRADRAADGPASSSSSTWSGSRSRWTPTTPRATPTLARGLDTSDRHRRDAGQRRPSTSG